VPTLLVVMLLVVMLLVVPLLVVPLLVVPLLVVMRQMPSSGVPSEAWYKNEKRRCCGVEDGRSITPMMIVIPP